MQKLHQSSYKIQEKSKLVKTLPFLIKSYYNKSYIYISHVYIYSRYPYGQVKLFLVMEYSSYTNGGEKKHHLENHKLRFDIHILKFTFENYLSFIIQYRHFFYNSIFLQSHQI